MEIRELHPDEWEKYRDIRLESLKVEPGAFKSNYDEEENRTEDEWRVRVPSTQKPCSQKFFAIEDGKAVGMMGLFQDRDGKDSDVVNIFGVYVSPDYRGKGISSQLLEELIRSAREVEGMKKIRLSVNQTQLPAIKLYQKHGFAIIEESEENNNYLMELVLK